jgi:hypothetical protein
LRILDCPVKPGDDTEGQKTGEAYRRPGIGMSPMGSNQVSASAVTGTFL